MRRLLWGVAVLVGGAPPPTLEHWVPRTEPLATFEAAEAARCGAKCAATCGVDDCGVCRCRGCAACASTPAFPTALWFLHFPKCGSTFHNSVYRLGCPNVPTPCVFGAPGTTCHLPDGATLNLLDAATYAAWR